MGRWTDGKIYPFNASYRTRISFLCNDILRYGRMDSKLPSSSCKLSSPVAIPLPLRFDKLESHMADLKDGVKAEFSSLEFLETRMVTTIERQFDAILRSVAERLEAKIAEERLNMEISLQVSGGVVVVAVVVVVVVVYEW